MYNSAGQGAPHGGPPDQGSPFGNLPPGFPPVLPGNPQLVPTRVWSDHKTLDGRTYYYNKVTKQSVWEMPKDFELVMPLPLSFSAPPNNEKTGMCECCVFRETFHCGNQL